MKLSKKLIQTFISLIIVSIVIISLISNVMINNRFEGFLINEREEKFQRIYEEINELYIENDFQLDTMELMHYALAEDINIVIKDVNNNIQYDSDTRARMGMGMGMGKNMRHGHMGARKRVPEGKFIEKSYPLYFKDQIVGSLVIGYIDNAHLTQSAILFKSTLFKSFALSGLITILVGLIFSIILSHRLTSPLVNIRNTANEIKSGNLKARSEIESDIREIAELSQSINFLGKTLAEQESIRKRYASDISHELRTPLTTLKSHLEAIVDGVWEPTEDHLNILMKEIQRLSGLIDDLKDSFVEQEYNIQLEKSKFDMSDEISNIITAYTPIYEKEDFSIKGSIEKNISVFMDKDKLRQIVNNLLSNSLRYLKESGEVYIELNKSNNIIILGISDNGRGIKEENLPYIFDRFYRVDSSRHKETGGTGLGLSIVKSMVEAHGGTINISSQYGKGTRVLIEFPLEY